MPSGPLGEYCLPTDLMDAAGAGLAPLPRVRPEGGHGWVLRLLGFLGWHLLLPDPLVDFGRCLPLHGFRHVGVDVQGGAGGPVPHHRREGLHVHTVLQRRGHKGVPEIVEPGFWALGPFQDPAQQLPDCRRVPRSVLLFGGRKDPAGIHLLPVAPHLLHHSGRENHGAEGGVRLGMGHCQLPPHPGDLSADAQLAGSKIQVIPLESQQLASPQACGQLQKKQLIAAVLLGLNEQSLHLILGQHLHLPPPPPPAACSPLRDLWDQPLLHRLGQCRPPCLSWW